MTTVLFLCSHHTSNRLKTSLFSSQHNTTKKAFRPIIGRKVLTSAVPPIFPLIKIIGQLINNRINAPARISLLSSANQLRDDFPAHRSQTPSSLRAPSLWEHADYYFPSLFLNIIIIAILAVNVKFSGCCSISLSPTRST